METKNKTIVSGVVMVVIGLGVGYYLGSAKSVNTVPVTMNTQSSMSMQDTMTSMNAGLEGKTGDAFDQAFLSEMIVHHEGAVAMAQLALTNANHQQVKDLATGIISAQNKEISEMKAWQTTWYGK